MNLKSCWEPRTSMASDSAIQQSKSHAQISKHMDSGSYCMFKPPSHMENGERGARLFPDSARPWPLRGKANSGRQSSSSRDLGGESIPSRKRSAAWTTQPSQQSESRGKTSSSSGHWESVEKVT